MKSSLLFLCIFVAILHLSVGGPLRLQKRAAFYIANETACVVDSTVYFNGDPIPTDDPCEACKCRPPGFACVLKECEVKPGCRAVRRAGYCCPEYICDPTIHNTLPVDNAYLFTNDAGTSPQTTYLPQSTVQPSKEGDTHSTFQPISNPSFELFGAGGRDSLEQAKPTFLNHDSNENETPPAAEDIDVGDAESNTNGPKQTVTTELQEDVKDTSPETIHLEVPKEDFKNPESEGKEFKNPTVLFKSDIELKHDENKVPQISAGETAYTIEQASKTEDTSTSSVASTLKEERQPPTVKSDLSSDEVETEPLTGQKATNTEPSSSTLVPASPLEVKNSAADNSKSLRFENEEKSTVTEISLEDEKKTKETDMEKSLTTTERSLGTTEIKGKENERVTELSETRTEEVTENKVTEFAKTTEISEDAEENKVSEDVKSTLNTEKKQILLEVSTVPVTVQSSPQEISNTATPHILPKEDEQGSTTETFSSSTKTKEVHLYKADKEKLKPESVETVTTIITIQKETNQPTNETDITTNIPLISSTQDNLLKSLDELITVTTDKKLEETTVREADENVEESKKLSTEDEQITKAISMEPDSEVEAESRSEETQDISPSTELKSEITMTTRAQAEVSIEHTMQPENEQIKEVTTQHEKLKTNE